jgi:hypothetical protein
MQAPSGKRRGYNKTVRRCKVFLAEFMGPVEAEFKSWPPIPARHAPASRAAGVSKRGATPYQTANWRELEVRAGLYQFTRFNDLARGGTISRSVAFRNIPGPSVPPDEAAGGLS